MVDRGSEGSGLIVDERAGSIEGESAVSERGLESQYLGWLTR